ncbi:uncharacterized protein LOC143781868 isoform X2 [Ranitomeya variabilis]
MNIAVEEEDDDEYLDRWRRSIERWRPGFEKNRFGRTSRVPTLETIFEEEEEEEEVEEEEEEEEEEEVEEEDDEEDEEEEAEEEVEEENDEEEEDEEEEEEKMITTSERSNEDSRLHFGCHIKTAWPSEESPLEEKRDQETTIVKISEIHGIEENIRPHNQKWWMPKCFRGKNRTAVKNIEEEKAQETTMVEIFQMDEMEENIKPYEIKTAWADTVPIPHKHKSWMPRCFRRKNRTADKNIEGEKGQETTMVEIFKMDEMEENIGPEEEKGQETTMIEIIDLDDIDENIEPYEIKTAWADTEPIPSKSDIKNPKRRPKLLRAFVYCFSRQTQ